MRPSPHGATVSEPLQRELTQGNPLAVLGACLHVVRVAGDRRSITGVRLCESKLEEIFLNVMGTVCGHDRSDVQAVIDIVYDVRPPPFPEVQADLFPFRPADQAFNTLSPFPIVQKKCLGSLYKICGQNNLLPVSMQIELPHTLTDTPRCHGGFADVLKWKHRGKEIAVKVLRIRSDSDLQRVTRVSYW